MRVLGKVMAVVLMAAATAWAQAPRCDAGGGASTRGARSPKFQLMDTVLSLGELTESKKCPLSAAQAKKAADLVKGLQRKSKLTDDDAKAALKSLKVGLTTRQLTELSRLSRERRERMMTRPPGRRDGRWQRWPRDGRRQGWPRDGRRLGWPRTAGRWGGMAGGKGGPGWLVARAAGMAGGKAVQPGAVARLQLLRAAQGRQPDGAAHVTSAEGALTALERAKAVAPPGCPRAATRCPARRHQAGAGASRAEEDPGKSVGVQEWEGWPAGSLAANRGSQNLLPLPEPQPSSSPHRTSGGR